MSDELGPTFRKTMAMNIVGAAGLWALTVAMYFNKFDELSPGILVMVVGFFALIATIPTATVFSFRPTATERLQKIMLSVNWMMIGLWGVSFIVTLCIDLQHLGQSLMSSIMFVFPELVNIKSLHEKLKGTGPAVPNDQAPPVKTYWKGAVTGIVATLVIVVIAYNIHRQTEKKPIELAAQQSQPRDEVQSNYSSAEPKDTAWTQSELNEPYMRSISKTQCMNKAAATLATCDSDQCLKNTGGITGDCIEESQGTKAEFCENHTKVLVDEKCAELKSSERTCKFLQYIASFTCNPEAK